MWRKMEAEWDQRYDLDTPDRRPSFFILRLSGCVIHPDSSLVQEDAGRVIVG